MSVSEVVAPTVLDAVGALAARHPEIDVLASSLDTSSFRYDAAGALRFTDIAPGPSVAFPTTVGQVQDVVRIAAEFGIPVVPRGAGSGLSGGAWATTGELVVSVERLTRILEVSPLDEVAVVEPGVINADLNAHLAPLGLFYAPDPASFEISSIGGNIATNAGGLRCAKYGVTRDSVLALDVVLADGSLVTVGHRSIKGVTGLDLVSLFTGSEGVLGIVVGATVRLRPLPVARRTVTAFFDSTTAGAAALAAVTLSPVRPSVLEFLDEPTLIGIDAHSGTTLRDRGAALLLIELDGYGIDEQTSDLRAALTAVGGIVTVEDTDTAEALWELRRHGRGLDGREWFTGDDIAVPKSQLPVVYGRFAEIAARHDVKIAAVAHAGDGNLHPLITRAKQPGETAAPAALHAAATELVHLALSLGGTVTGEHGLGLLKREWAPLELSERNLAAQHAIKGALDPLGLFNPGKAL